MNEILRVLRSRRSVRSFKNEPVPAELIREVVDAGRYAPTGMNRQSVFFAAVTDRALISRLSAMNAAVMGGGSDPFYGAPALVAVFADRRVATFVEDGSLALGNMLNAAFSLGLGSCWIHRAEEVFESDSGRALAREWGVPDHCRGIGFCILGYPAAPASAPSPRRDNTVFIG